MNSSPPEGRNGNDGEVHTDWVEKKKSDRKWDVVAQNDRDRYFSEEWKVIRTERERLFDDLVRISPGEKLLDVGCGSGKESLLALQRGAIVTAFDSTPEMVEVANQWAKDSGYTLNAYVADATKRINDPDATYDKVWCMLVLHHLPDPHAVVREFHRVLRPHGKAYVGVANALGIHGTLFIMLMKLFGQTSKGYCHHFTYREAKQMFGHAGFAIKRVYARNLLPPLSGIYTSDIRRYTFFPKWLIRLLDKLYLAIECNLRKVTPFKYFGFLMMIEAEKLDHP
jgi:2-polyprenyl-3-methyl-5-hydroxy-6-metoxy-1,4-benzoquinol methylase